MTNQVNEQSTAYLNVRFLDKAGALATPTAVTYRIDCLTSGEAVRAATTVIAASELEIVLTAADNAIKKQTNLAEHRRVTLVASYGSAIDQATMQMDYTVSNLQFIG